MLSARRIVHCFVLLCFLVFVYQSIVDQSIVEADQSQAAHEQFMDRQAKMTSIKQTASINQSINPNNQTRSLWFTLPFVAISGLVCAYAYYSYRKWKQSVSQVPINPINQTILTLTRRGRIQSLDWATKSLKFDEDGDHAHEFLGPFPNPSVKQPAPQADSPLAEQPAEPSAEPTAEATVSKKDLKKRR